VSDVAGQWFDGRASRPRPVRLSLEAADALAIRTDDGAETLWPVSEVELSARLGSTPRRLQRSGHGHIECPDSPLLDAWLPRRSSRVEQWADRLERRRPAIAAAAGATLIGIVAFVQWGLPAGAKLAAERMPRAVEQHASDQAITLLRRVGMMPSRLPQARRADLRARFNALVADEPRAGQFMLEFVHAPEMGANAFALPDGRIFVTDALVELAGTDEELLAVLAHEAGHHVHRHGMRQALESSGVFVLAGLVFGDASGSALAVSIPATLLSNGFSRNHEREADAYAFGLLERRGVSPRSFAAIMRRLSEAHGGEGGELVAYLSTHPPTPERIAAAEAAAGARGP
jgi:Zn-dependent protease with chaperone function